MDITGLKVGAVIVTYNNPSGLGSLILDLKKQTFRISEIIVIDNSSDDISENLIRDKYNDVRYVRFRDNIGSAGGFHEGIKTALENNDHIWTLDDDVSLNDDTLSNLLEGLKSIEDVPRVGAVRSVFKRLSAPPYEEIYTFAWRGTLLNAKAVRENGLPMKELFLYVEDVEYALRLAKAGYKMFNINSSVFSFKRCSQVTTSFLGIQITSYQDIFRLYYAFRNETIICLQYKTYKRLLKNILYGIGIILSVKEQRMKRANAIAEGFLDGFASKYGKNMKYIPV